MLYILQEGMDTLGKEIDRLSHENSRLKRDCTSLVPEKQDASSDKHSWYSHTNLLFSKPSCLWMSCFVLHRNN